jgi:nanoRNase/pAp phosphatase (c-di-AMP/oligoRNAs hydrolase)
MSEREKSSSDFEKFKSLIERAGKGKVAIFTHAGPDPDAISSMLGVSYLLENRFGIESDCFYTGEISHPQNKAMVQLLDVHLIKIEDDEDGSFKADGYELRILVDTIPINAGVKGKVHFDLVIDHHKELPNGGFNGVLIHHHTGSCAGIVYDILRESGLSFSDENEKWIKVANALMVGIITDTDHCMSVDTTRRDFLARQELFPFQDHDLIRKIVKFNRPMSWIKLKGMAINEATIEEGVAVVGLGILPDEQRDVIADIASDMLTWGSVQTAVVFALFGDRIEGSVRTNNEAVEIHAMCNSLGGKHGCGGGKLCKGAYRKSLGSMSLDEDDEENLKSQMWEVIKRRETSKIFKIVKQ